MNDIMFEYGIVASQEDEKKIVKNINDFLKTKEYSKMSKNSNSSMLKARLPFEYKHYYYQLKKQEPRWYFELYPNSDLNSKLKFTNQPGVWWVLFVKSTHIGFNNQAQIDELNGFFEELLASTGYKTNLLYEYSTNEERL